MPRMAIFGSLLFIAVAACIASALQGLSFSQGYDPFDKFEVIRIISDNTGQHHAIVSTYEHADSSAVVTAVWIESGAPPLIGSHEPRIGAPILVERTLNSRRALHVVNNLLQVAATDAERANARTEITLCYFEDVALCYDPGAVQLIAP